MHGAYVQSCTVRTFGRWLEEEGSEGAADMPCLPWVAHVPPPGFPGEMVPAVSAEGEWLLYGVQLQVVFAAFVPGSRPPPNFYVK